MLETAVVIQGCGKSTLMTLICSEMNATEGKDHRAVCAELHDRCWLAMM